MKLVSVYSFFRVIDTDFVVVRSTSGRGNKCFNFTCVALSFSIFSNFMIKVVVSLCLCISILKLYRAIAHD